MNLFKHIHRLAAVKIWAVIFMLCLATTSVSYGQYEIGKEFIEQKTREFHSLKHTPKGRWAFSKKYKTWNPKDGIVLSSVKFQDGYWPEIEVTFSKKRVSIGDRIIVKAKRRLHPRNKERYETRFDKYKEEGLPVRIGSDMTMIDSISVPRKPDKYNYVWMYPGEEIAFEYEVHDNMEHYRTKSQHVTLSVGGGEFGELRHYFIYPAGVDTTVKKLHRFGPKRIKVDTNRQKYHSPGY